jgi:uncharacterized damage-inducible protein DinB
MKELLLQYSNANLWANKRIIKALLQHDESALDMEMISSFPTIKATVFHVWSAESIWLQRLQHTEEPIWWQGVYKGTFTEAYKAWEETSDALIQFIEQRNDELLKEVLKYHDRSNNAHHTPVYQVLLHVFNHSTYHRGQLVTMLRQAGIKEIPGTDFISFVR